MGRGSQDLKPGSNQGLQVTAYSVRSVRREATCQNVETPSGIQVPDEPVGLSAPDHSGV
jgi:hypothetical protein